MEFTFTFVKLYVYGLTLAAPLLIFYDHFMLGQIVGKKAPQTTFDRFDGSFTKATTAEGQFQVNGNLYDP